MLTSAPTDPERIGIAIQANRFARVCLEESISECEYLQLHWQ